MSASIPAGRPASRWQWRDIRKRSAKTRVWRGGTSTILMSGQIRFEPAIRNATTNWFPFGRNCRARNLKSAGGFQLYRLAGQRKDGQPRNQAYRMDSSTDPKELTVSSETMTRHAEQWRCGLRPTLPTRASVTFRPHDKPKKGTERSLRCEPRYPENGWLGYPPHSTQNTGTNAPAESITRQQSITGRCTATTPH